MTVREHDAVRSLRLGAELAEAFRGVGTESRSSCGCLWRRIPAGGFVFHGFWLSGDVVVRSCPYHEWYSRQPLAVQRQVEAQRRRREQGEENWA